MSKGVDEQNVPIETRARRGRKQSRLRDMLSALENRVVYLKKSIGEVKETLELDSIKEQFKEYVEEALSSNVDTLQTLLNIVVDNLTKRNNALEATVMALNTKIKELERKLAVYRVVLGKEVLNEHQAIRLMSPSQRSSMGQVERRGHKATIGTWEEFQKEFKEQFYPQYGEKEACAKFCQFSQ
ncbi:hypothetical protein PVK06_002405 [Gossypium arboreum]|uniref:Uncharacterized protein n=1 Tax=Gossypium arboreum TaxID=29729 RepID=A0ABR0R3N1_GOSAR|nr:hypothetical protein PVK06_002405 [Gossypium arboreum]